MTRRDKDVCQFLNSLAAHVFPTMIVSLGVLSFFLGGAFAGPSFYKYAPIPTARSNAVGGILYDKYNSPEVWVVGGRGADDVGNVVEVYSATWDEWKSYPSLLSSRYDHSAVPLNGTMYAGGGIVSCSDSEYCTTNTVEYYSFSTSSWVSTTPMNTPRSGHVFAVDETTNMIYALGGMDSSSQYLASMEVYDLNTNKWTELPSMPTPRTGLNAVIMNSKLYALGGCGGATSTCEALSTVEVYDFTTQAWSTLPSLLHPRHSFSLGVYGTQLIVAGGSSAAGMAQDGTGLIKAIDIFDANSNEWFVVTYMPDPRVGLVKGYNLFVGISMFLISGTSADNKVVNTNELMALMCYKDGEKGKLDHPLCL